MTPAESTTRPQTSTRLVSLDAFRGLAVALMLFVNTPGLSSATPTQLKHAPWEGLTVADLVFPMFLLAVGMSVPLSRRSSVAREMVKRVAILFALGNVIVWIKYDQWFELTTGVLQFIALAYLVGWLLVRLPGRWPLMASVVLLGGASVTFAATGGWERGDNVASDIDEVWLGASSDLGLLAAVCAGTVVVAGAYVTRAMLADPEGRRRVLAVVGCAATAAGLVAWLAVPVIKRLWTPSFVVLTIGLACLVLLVVDVLVARPRGQRLARPLVDIGMNPLAVYVVITLLDAVVLGDVSDDVVRWVSPPLAESVASVGWSLLVVLLAWVLAAALRKRSIFIRI